METEEMIQSLSNVGVVLENMIIQGSQAPSMAFATQELKKVIETLNLSLQQEQEKQQVKQLNKQNIKK